MKSNWKAPILAALGLVALAVAIPMGVANAQQNDQGFGQRTQGGPPQGGFQGGPPQGGFAGAPDMMQRGGMMGGQATMVADNNFLFILQGNQLFKVNKNTLEVVGQGMLPMPGPRFDGPGAGGPGAPGARAGGGGARAGGGGGGEDSADGTAK